MSFLSISPGTTLRRAAAGLAALCLLAGSASAAMPSLEEGRKFWSLQPVADPAPPEVRDAAWAVSPIDRFILAKLEAKGLRPAPPAEPLALLRRLCFDLTGVPPSPEQMERYAADPSPAGHARMVEELLASPAYGERQGRHWLDVARYADTAGDSSDYPVPDAIRYRDWVIAACNADMPYDRFLQEQIAGDLLPAESEAARHSQQIATGFIALSRRFGVNAETEMNQTIEDTLSTVGQATMGLTLGCARCHDHKFDPIRAKDYYSLYGIFSSTRYPYAGSEERQRPENLTPLISDSERAKMEEPYQAELAAVDADLAVVKKERAELRAAREAGLPQPGKRSNLQLLDAFRGLQKKRQDITDRMPEYATAFAVADMPEPANARVQIRGEASKPGAEAPRGFPEVLGGWRVPAEERGSGRLELARWITDAKNPLTARVMVNRIWQQHFGQGLVGTPNDFGRQGQKPTHPELLDWLAARFVEDGWSVKKMHRRILESAAWRQSCADNPSAAEADPNNELLWRMNRRRLDAESLRDALLSVSGKLEPGPGGRHPFPPKQQWGWSQHNPFNAVYESNRRSVYLMQQRLKRHPFLAVFDGADTNASTGERLTSITPLQALFHLNNPFVHEQADALVNRLNAEADPAKRVDLACRLALGRSAETGETAAALEYIEAFAEKSGDARAAWASYARALLGSSEFSWLD